MKKLASGGGLVWGAFLVGFCIVGCLQFAMAMEAGESVEAFVDRVVHNSRTVVFSKSYCPYCTRAKEALDKAGYLKTGAVVVELDKHAQGPAIQNYLAKITQQTTVPNVFVNGQHIGGCDKTLAALSKGAL